MGISNQLAGGTLRIPSKNVSSRTGVRPFGLIFRSKDGEVASYRDVRLDTTLITENLFAKFNEKVRRQLLALLPAIYRTGYHHFFYFKQK